MQRLASASMPDPPPGPDAPFAAGRACGGPAAALGAGSPFAPPPAPPPASGASASPFLDSELWQPGPLPAPPTPPPRRRPTSSPRSGSGACRPHRRGARAAASQGAAASGKSGNSSAGCTGAGLHARSAPIASWKRSSARPARPRQPLPPVSPARACMQLMRQTSARPPGGAAPRCCPLSMARFKVCMQLVRGAALGLQDVATAAVSPGADSAAGALIVQEHCAVSSPSKLS